MLRYEDVVTFAPQVDFHCEPCGEPLLDAEVYDRANQLNLGVCCAPCGRARVRRWIAEERQASRTEMTQCSGVSC